MKTAILTSIFTFTFFASSFANPVVKEKTVVAYIEYCSQGEFDKIIGLFDANLSSFIAPDEIKGSWNDVQTKYSKFVSIKEMKTSRVGNFDISKVLCQFENNTCLFVFTFDDGGNLKSVLKSTSTN